MSPQINHIFYTDDDPDDQDFFSMALAEVKPSAKLHAFHNCKQVLDYLKDESNPFPDIIFLDQNMHGNTNNECLKEIKKIARLEKIPVVIYTTGGKPELVAQALELGAYKYVLKPIRIDDVKNNIRTIISECEKLDS